MLAGRRQNSAAEADARTGASPPAARWVASASWVLLACWLVVGSAWFVPPRDASFADLQTDVAFGPHRQGHDQRGPRR